MIDRLVHHAEVIALKGDSYRLKDRDLDASPQPARPTTMTKGVNFHLPEGGQFSAAVDTHRLGRPSGGPGAWATFP